LNCFFVSDIHGMPGRYEKLFDQVRKERPDALFLGGDLLPSPFSQVAAPGLDYKNFLEDFLLNEINNLKKSMKDSYPRVFAILGNDDARLEENTMKKAEKMGLWHYCHLRRIRWEGFSVYGYTFIPPTPFRLKDWERYDVTRYVRPGCIAPEDGVFTVQVPEGELMSTTIENDLERLTGDHDLGKSIFLFHSPPHCSRLDRAALDGRRIDDVQVDVHVGSTAIKRFIEKRQPLVTLHGHIHESTRLTGSWRDKFKRTESFNASHDGPELALVRFNPYQPQNASRELI
jgi:Icc-related predicted phosphoesterase